MCPASTFVSRPRPVEQDEVSHQRAGEQHMRSSQGPAAPGSGSTRARSVSSVPSAPACCCGSCGWLDWLRLSVARARHAPAAPSSAMYINQRAFGARSRTGPAQLDYTVCNRKPISEGHSFHYAGAPYKCLYGGAPYKSPKIAENHRKFPKIAENSSFRPTSEGHSYYYRL